MRIKTCCICGQPIEGWGNNPWGVLDEDGNYRSWKPTDICCDKCNSEIVVPGRLKKYLEK